MPPKHRLAIVLHHIGQLSTAEIARQQNVAEGTVRSWLSRGRSQLAEQLAETDTPATWEAMPGIPAPGLDKAISSVRRRRGVRRATLAAAVAVLLALPIAIILRGKGSEPPVIGPTSPPSSPSPSPVVSATPVAKAVSACTGKPLARIPDTPPATFSGGDPTGRFLVGHYLHTAPTYKPGDPADYRPVLWTDGKPSTFVIPGRVLTGIAVNSHGVVAGSSSHDGQSGFSLWTYHDGRLDVLHETNSRADARSVIDINARGDILLSGVDGHGETPRPASIRLARTSPVFRDLRLPEGATHVVHDLGEDGTVVGSVRPGGAAYWTPDQAFHQLPAPEGRTAAVLSIRGDWVVGVAIRLTADRPAYPVDRIVLRWNLRTGAVNQVPEMGLASGVTAHGWVLGSKDDSPVLDMDGQRLPLPKISGRPSTDTPYVAFISDDGRIIGGESKVAGSGDNLAIAWSCS